MEYLIIKYIFISLLFKGPLSGLRHFLTTESFLKMMKNAFGFMLKALFVLVILIFLSHSNWNRTRNHLVCKQKLNHSAKLAK